MISPYLLRSALAQDDCNMRIAAEYRLETTACTKTAPFAGGSLICKDLGNNQIVAADAKIFLGIRDCGSQQFAYRQCGSFGDKAQHFERFIRASASDQIDHQADLLGGHREKTEMCLNISHSYLSYGAAFSAAIWPRKVRVGANSPSRWPTMFS